MKITIDGCEVEIKAKKIGEDKYNEEDTMYILNTISVYAHAAAVRYRDVKLNALAKQAEKTAETIYNKLDSKGLYDNI